MLYDNFLEINYTTPTGSRGCFRFLVNTNEYISTSFFAVQPQTALKQVFEAVTWSSDAAENFRAIKEFYTKAIEKMKGADWYLYIAREKAERSADVEKMQKMLECALQEKRAAAFWDRKTIENRIDKINIEVNFYQNYFNNLKIDPVYKSHAKERKALERLEKNYNFFLKFIEKLNSKKNSRRRAA